MAFVLTPRLETSARQAFGISNGDPLSFIHKPIALGFLAATLLFFVGAPWRWGFTGRGGRR